MQARQSGERRRVLVFAQERDVLRYLRAAGPAGGPYAAWVPTPEAVAAGNIDVLNRNCLHPGLPPRTPRLSARRP